MKQKSVC